MYFPLLLYIKCTWNLPAASYTEIIGPPTVRSTEHVSSILDELPHVSSSSPSLGFFSTFPTKGLICLKEVNLFVDISLTNNSSKFCRPHKSKCEKTKTKTIRTSQHRLLLAVIWTDKNSSRKTLVKRFYRQKFRGGRKKKTRNRIIRSISWLEPPGIHPAYSSDNL